MITTLFCGRVLIWRHLGGASLNIHRRVAEAGARGERAGLSTDVFGDGLQEDVKTLTVVSVDTEGEQQLGSARLGGFPQTQAVRGSGRVKTNCPLLMV